jgi:hypothetical protein
MAPPDRGGIRSGAVLIAAAGTAISRSCRRPQFDRESRALTSEQMLLTVPRRFLFGAHPLRRIDV